MITSAMATGLRVGTAIGLCFGLGACMTARETEPADLGILEQALTAPVEDLLQEADEGQAQAQYALSVLYAYGARNLAADQAQAALMRRKALGARGYTPITTYIAGLRGKPGRVAIINTPRYALNSVQVFRVDQCISWLARGDTNKAAVEACAGHAAFDRLKALWAKARPVR
jgi:hypothetical protein